MRRILFRKISDPYGCFSNFSRHPVLIDGLEWRTTEHYFQASKFLGTDNEHALAIRAVASPAAAARMGRSRSHPIRPDWEATKDDVMRRAVRAKVGQHADVRETLAETGDAEIVEHSPRDTYWGDGGDGSGRNVLGRILMEVRTELLDPERPWKHDPDAPLLDNYATLRYDHYTPENICRAMSIASFVPPPANEGTSARILLVPSFSSEVCVTVDTSPSDTPCATVHALAEHLYAQQFPTFPAFCGVERVSLEEDLTDRLLACLTDGHEVRRDGACIDGMSYHSAVRTASGVTRRNEHFGMDRPARTVLREFVPALLSGTSEERCRRGLTGVAWHLGLNVDAPS